MADTIFKIPKLKGSSNYDIWSIRVQAILVEKGYLEVIADNYIELKIITLHRPPSPKRD
jgi:hypothetical protein